MGNCGSGSDKKLGGFVANAGGKRGKDDQYPGNTKEERDAWLNQIVEPRGFALMKSPFVRDSLLWMERRVKNDFEDIPFQGTVDTGGSFRDLFRHSIIQMYYAYKV